MMRVARSSPLLALAGAALTACDTGVITEDRGPPAGYAVLSGSVSRTNGTPQANAEVVFTRCGSPIGGYLAGDTTDAAGQFRVTAKLPPIGVLPGLNLDSLVVRCDVFVNRGATPQDSVLVKFRRTSATAPTTTVNLVVTP